MKKTWMKKVLVSLFLAVLFTWIAGNGYLFQVEQAVADKLYYEPVAHDGDIVVLEIDQEALEEIGPWPWSRDVMATVIEKLNQNPEAKPVVIGVDAFYGGETNSEADAHLASAASGENVVFAEMVEFSDELKVSGESFGVEQTIVGYDRVYNALAQNSLQGHINQMQAVDGVLREGLLYVEPEEDKRLYSFAWVIYEAYCKATGTTPNRMPDTNQKGFFYIPYTVAPGGFTDKISVADVYFDRVSGEYFADRIVLIGPYAAGLQDQYITSIDHAVPMYGVEIQANIIQSFLSGNYMRASQRTWQLVLLFGLCVASVWFFWGRKVRWSLLWWLGISGGWLGLCKVLGAKGILLQVLWIPLGITILFIVFVAINYIQAAMEKKKVTDTFKRYVDPSVIKELLREGTDSLGLGGKMTDIAVLFVDIRGFTTMSEVLSPPEIVEILNRYLSLTTKCVMENHGTLDKFVGDCTMAIWNAPLKQEDYIMNACKAALDMVEGSKELEKELRETYGRTVSFGVGVHCGKAVVGNIGAQMRMDFTAIGDTVNTAARLEANAPGGCIYISRAVADALEGRIETTSLGSTIKLKGKADGFEILTLDGLNK